jgi:hypothetical protein
MPSVVGVNFKWKPKNEIALTNEAFTPMHGAAANLAPAVAAVRGLGATGRESQFARHESHATSLLSLTTHHSPLVTAAINR